MAARRRRTLLQGTPSATSDAGHTAATGTRPVPGGNSRSGGNVLQLPPVPGGTAHGRPGPASLLRLAGALQTTVRELTGGDIDLPPGLGRAGRHPKFTELPSEACWDLLSTHGVGRLAIPSAPARWSSP